VKKTIRLLAASVFSGMQDKKKRKEKKRKLDSLPGFRQGLTGLASVRQAHYNALNSPPVGGSVEL
jgi:hypothetical protein